jgi:hypothetical protein
MKCSKCDFETESPIGFKQHMSKSHGGYFQKDLTDAGITPTRSDVARSLDSGRTSIGDVLKDAPDGETTDETKQSGRGRPRGTQSKAARAEAEQQAEFDRLRPLLVSKWKRRLRIPYSLWARLAGDPQVALSEKEVEEGAELHVEFVQAMGWVHAGKVEAVVDLAMWHGATILGRSEIGQNLIKTFTMPEAEPEEKDKPN